MGLLRLALSAFILTAVPALAQNTPQLFVLAKDQDSQLKKAFLNRALHSNNPLACTRAMYGPDYLIHHPLADSDYEILKELGDTDSADQANNFPFINNRDGWCLEVQHGQCMFVSASRRDLRKLLAFDPDTKDAAAEALKNDPAGLYAYYEKMVWDLFRYKRPTLIEGFANLNQFASDPVVNQVFRAAIPYGWADYASIPKIAVGVLLKSRKPMKLDAIPEELQNLISKRAKHYYPLVFLGARKQVYPSDPVSSGPQPLAGEREPLPMDLLESLSLRQPISAKQAGFDVLPPIDVTDPAVLEMLRHEPGYQEAAAPSQPGAPKLEFQSLTGFIDDLSATYIHVVAVREIKELEKGVKWELDMVDPNAFPNRNVGTLKIDLSNKEHPVIYYGASAQLYIDSFGELPGDREHMDEIVANWIELQEKDPARFKRMVELMNRPKGGGQLRFRGMLRR